MHLKLVEFKQVNVSNNIDNHTGTSQSLLGGLIASLEHLHPRLTIGYQAVITDLEPPCGGPAKTKELIAPRENSGCHTNAVQFLAGTTFDKSSNLLTLCLECAGS
jgi:formylmethanofuran dehydrogenase subunit E